MQSVLIVIHLMIVIMLVVTVLLQRSEGGALGIGGGGGFLTGRGQANALTRATAILAGLFFLTSLSLTILARFGQGPEVTFQSITPVEPAGVGKQEKEGQSKGSLLDQLKRMEGEPAQPPALPPGVSLPSEMSVPAEAEETVPEETNSVIQIAPPKGLGLPASKQPATPLATLPAQPGPGNVAPLAPAPKPSPFKAEPPTSEPWAK
jgi:preprotein translocase subunit SecG